MTLHIHRLENILQHINTCSCTHTSAGVIPPIVDVDVEDIVLFFMAKTSHMYLYIITQLSDDIALSPTSPKGTLQKSN